MLVGCEASEDEEIATGPVEITFWHVVNGEQAVLLNELTDRFMAANPEIIVKLESQPDHNELSATISSTLISPDHLPTMTQAYIDWLLYPIQDGLVLDILPLITDTPDKTASYNDINPEFLTHLMIDGGLYGMPFTKSSEVIWYNKTIFDELGLTPPDTFDELVTVSKEIYEKKGIPGAGFDSLSNYFYSYLNYLGVTFDPNEDQMAALKEMAHYYLDGIKEGYFRIAGTDKYLSQPMGDQKLAMYIGSTAAGTFIEKNAAGKFELATASYPDEYAIQQGTDAFIFTTASKREQDAALQYVNFLASPEIQLEWAIETGYLPIRNSVLNSEEYLDSNSLIPGLIEHMFSKPVVPNGNAVIAEIEMVLETILSQEDTTDAEVEKNLQNLQYSLSSIWE
ncbi:extracellular solute-binding protein [Candidatus Epulonipiscium viviparus]|uniref:extracellular solute-binding protein n=1 Tax=Candidatus Epulonipiscium viviparus TaxID=420336 RepID=UPI003A7F3DA2